jgi:hypothetical protein
MRTRPWGETLVDASRGALLSDFQGGVKYDPASTKAEMPADDVSLGASWVDPPPHPPIARATATTIEA